MKLLLALAVLLSGCAPRVVCQPVKVECECKNPTWNIGTPLPGSGWGVPNDGLQISTSIYFNLPAIQTNITPGSHMCGDIKVSPGGVRYRKRCFQSETLTPGSTIYLEPGGR